MFFFLVDDNRLLNRFFTTYLREKGHRASSVAKSEEVMNWLNTNPDCDCVLLDPGMPTVNGITLTSVIRSKYPRILIVIFGGIPDDADAMEVFRRAGANGYVSKNLGPSKIYSALIRVCHLDAGIDVAVPCLKPIPQEPSRSENKPTDSEIESARDVSGTGKQISPLPSEFASPKENEGASQTPKLRLCFLVSPADRDWGLDTQRLQSRLAARLQKEQIASITFDRRDPAEPLVFPDRREQETICCLYHASCDVSATAVNDRLPEFICLLRISGGTFEIDPPPAANAGSHFHFVCADLDYASWFHWLERWHTGNAFDPLHFAVACTALKKCSDILLETESLLKASLSILASVASTVNDTPDDGLVTLPEPLRMQIESCLASFEKVGVVLESATQRETVALNGAFWSLKWQLDNLMKEERNKKATYLDIVDKIKKAITLVTISESDFRDRSALHEEYREMKHITCNSLAALMASAELALRNPVHYPNVIDSTLRLGLTIREELQDFSNVFLPFPEALLRSWVARKRDYDDTLAVFLALAELSKRNPAHCEKLAKVILARSSIMVQSLQDGQNELERELFDNRLTNRTDPPAAVF